MLEVGVRVVERKVDSKTGRERLQSGLIGDVPI